jgi:hypothetical protein
MLLLTFHPAGGGTPVQTRAAYFRICSDATLRGADNAVVAVCMDNRWRLGQRLFREFDCSGPVWLRSHKSQGGVAVVMGPYERMKSVHGHLYGDDVPLAVDIPGWQYSVKGFCYELSLLPATP